MATNLDGNELVQQGQVRAFYQPDGPGGTTYFYGIDTNYFFLSGASLPVNGGVEPVYVADPARPNRYRLVARSVGEPEAPTVELEWHDRWGGVPRVLLAPTCPFNIYAVRGRCADLSDLLRGWDDFILVFSQAIYNGNADLGALMQRNASEALTTSVSAQCRAIYPIASLFAGEEATTDIVVQVMDGVYAPPGSCAECGPSRNGDEVLYLLTRANVGSPGAPGQIVYTTNAGTTWSTNTITGIGSTNEVRGIDLAGSVLFVWNAGTSVFYSAVTETTGVPGTWSSVVEPVAMNDIHVRSPRDIWAVAAAGAIYATTDIAAAMTLRATVGSAAYNRIHGRDQTLVAVGDNGAVAYSQNAGSTWGSATVPAATNLAAVAVLTSRRWLVGGANGLLYRTTDAGVTWTTITLPGTAGSIQDIVAPTAEAIWISSTVSSQARIFYSLDGGNSWGRDDSGSNRLVGYNAASFGASRRLVVNEDADPAIAANTLAICAVTAAGTDGAVILPQMRVL